MDEGLRPAPCGPETRSPEEIAAGRLLDAVWDVPVGLGLCDERVRFVRVNGALADFDGLAIPAHYRDDTLGRLPPAFAEGLLAANEGNAHDVEFTHAGCAVLV